MAPRSVAGHVPDADRFTVVDALTQLSFLVQSTLERRAAAHGLSLVQTRLLGILRDRTPTMNELARLLGLDKSSATGLVDRAERRGLVLRRRSPTDRRSVHVALTEQGRSLVAGVAATFEAELAELLAPLSDPERRTLSSLAGRVLVAHATERGVDLFATLDRTD